MPLNSTFEQSLTTQLNGVREYARQMEAAYPQALRLLEPVHSIVERWTDENPQRTVVCHCQSVHDFFRIDVALAPDDTLRNLKYLARALTQHLGQQPEGLEASAGIVGGMRWRLDVPFNFNLWLDLRLTSSATCEIVRIEETVTETRTRYESRCRDGAELFAPEADLLPSGSNDPDLIPF